MSKYQKATFAAGCDWHLEDYFSNLDGIEHILKGTAGEDKSDPTVRDIGDNNEIVEVQFDPSVITYPDLLNHFWTQHDPTVPGQGKYASVIFTHGKEQYEEALRSRDEQERKRGKPVVTQVMPVAALSTGSKIIWRSVPKHRELRYKVSC